ncbi:MAG: PorV/PorQ family protein [bacterium]|jgi:hypothetical protein
MRKTIALAAICALLAGAGTASAAVDKVGSSSALFLKIGIDSRGVAMGEAYAASVWGAPSVFSNPAGLAGLDGDEVFVSDAEWLADVRLIGGAYAFKYKELGTFAFSVLTADYGEMQLVSEHSSTEASGTFTARDIAVGFTYAKRWTDMLYVGGTFKYIDQSIYDYSARGVAFDFGTVYHTGFNSLRLAMATTNFGPDLVYDGSYTDKYYIGTSHIEEVRMFGSNDLPLNFRLGIAYDWEFGQNSVLTMALDATHPTDYSERVHLGGEYGWNNTVFVRMGYTTNAEEMGISGGAGVKLDTSFGATAVDYAYTEFGVFSGVHRISMRLRW